MPRTASEVRVHRRRKLVEARLECTAQPAQVIHALCVVRRDVALRGAHAQQLSVQSTGGWQRCVHTKKYSAPRARCYHRMEFYGRCMNIRTYRECTPRLGAQVYVDPAAVLIGNVELGDDASLWPCSVVRGDVNFIRIGARSNIQDGAVLHVTHDGPYTPGGFPLLIGADVTIGHSAVLHACTIEDACLI